MVALRFVNPRLATYVGSRHRPNDITPRTEGVRVPNDVTTVHVLSKPLAEPVPSLE